MHCLQSGNFPAGAKFLQIGEALNLLVDAKARAALDDVIR